MATEGIIRAHSEVFTRNEFGQFQDHSLRAARKTAEDAAEEGARVARALAPKKTGYMASTIRASVAVGVGVSMMAEFKIGTSHWKYQELGTTPHKITGWVNFFWERESRKWNPGPNTISHPGNRAIHFMAAGFDAAETKLIEGMNRNYRLSASL